MMSEVETVMFAIQAAVKLGRKVQSVFEDEVRDREFILPQVSGTDKPALAEAVQFFEGEGRSFVQAPDSQKATVAGVYYPNWENRGRSNADNDKIVDAYWRIHEHIRIHSEREDVRGGFRNAATYYKGVNALLAIKQWRESADVKRNPVQRIAANVVGIALDYVKADATLFGGDGVGDRVTRGFLLSLNDVEFAESRFDDLLLDMLRASLDTFRAQADLVISEDLLAMLLGQISAVLSEGIGQAQESGDGNQVRVLYTFRRGLLQNVIKISAQTVSEYGDLFLGESGTRQREMVSAVLKALLGALSQAPDIFSGRTLTDLYAAGLQAVANNAHLLLADKRDTEPGAFIQALIAGVANELAASARREPVGLLLPDMLKDVVEIALQTLTDNSVRLIDMEAPEKQLLVAALRDIIAAFASDVHGDAAIAVRLKGIFTKQQLIQIVGEVFDAVAQNPWGLLGGIKGDAKGCTLTHIIVSVALAAGTDAAKLLQGQDYCELIAAALRAFAINPDRLLDPDTSDPRQSVLCQVIHSVAATAIRHIETGGRRLAQGGKLVQLIDAALKAVSKNTDGFRKEPEIVAMVTDRLLCAASGIMANEMDAENLLKVFPVVLADALKDRKALDVSDAQLVLPHLGLTV